MSGLFLIVLTKLFWSDAASKWIKDDAFLAEAFFLMQPVHHTKSN